MLEQDMFEGMEKDTQKSNRFAKASWCKRIKGMRFAMVRVSPRFIALELVHN